MLVKYVSIDGIPQAFVFFRFVDVIGLVLRENCKSKQVTDFIA
jgi:hypothetical protein